MTEKQYTIIEGDIERKPCAIPAGLELRPTKGAGTCIAASVHLIVEVPFGQVTPPVVLECKLGDVERAFGADFRENTPDFWLAIPNQAREPLTVRYKDPWSAASALVRRA